MKLNKILLAVPFLALFFTACPVTEYGKVEFDHSEFFSEYQKWNSNKPESYSFSYRVFFPFSTFEFREYEVTVRPDNTKVTLIDCNDYSDYCHDCYIDNMEPKDIEDYFYDSYKETCQEKGTDPLSREDYLYNSFYKHAFKSIGEIYDFIYSYYETEEKLINSDKYVSLDVYYDQSYHYPESFYPHEICRSEHKPYPHVNFSIHKFKELKD